MGKPGAFLAVERTENTHRAADVAVRDFNDIAEPLPMAKRCAQASRCMYCGVAFCQAGMKIGGTRRQTGCPLHNLIPETNDLIWQGRWGDAAARLALTNPFPEFTGRVCPALCETACNLGLHDEAVTIRDNERAISDWAFFGGTVTSGRGQLPAIAQPLAPAPSKAPLVSVVGSGPAGLACAWELTRLGVRVRVVERADRAGGLLMYGIPNMKLPKDVVARRLRLMRESGIRFDCNTDASQPEVADTLRETSQAIVLAAGATVPRHVDVEGADAENILFAVDYLKEATAALLDGRKAAISAAGKDVVVIGGGDTGVDCVATAVRQGAKSVRQVIRAAAAPASPDTFAAWPNDAGAFSTAYGQEEAATVFGEDPRIFSVDTVGYEVSDGAVSGVVVQDISYEGGRHNVEGTERTIPAQLVLVAKGFVGMEASLLGAFDVKVRDDRPLPCVEGDTHRTVLANVRPDDEPALYVAGDARTGATLVVSAIADGMACAREIAAAVR